MRVALATDLLLTRRGAERTFEVMCDAFPRADIYSLIHDPQAIPLNGRSVTTSFIQDIPRAASFYRRLYPLYPIVIELFDFRDYDLVISSSAMWAHGILTHPDTCHICYCHTPFRYIWSHYHEFIHHSFGRSWVQALLRAVLLNRIRTWDYNAAQRVGYYIANSEHVQKRIKSYYGRDSMVVHPPVDISRFTATPEHSDFYLIVSALLPYKRIDIAVNAFMRLGYELKVIGTGPEMSRLKKMSARSSNVEFLGWLSDAEVAEYYQECRAVIICGEEDFCIVSVEAQAAGKPVIAYRSGGTLATVIDSVTGCFFESQTSEGLERAIIDFESRAFSYKKIRRNAEAFREEIFRRRLRDLAFERLEVS